MGTTQLPDLASLAAGAVALDFEANRTHRVAGWRGTGKLAGVSFAHITLPTRDVRATAAFLEQTLGYRRVHAPENAPMSVTWLDIGRGQQIHIIHVEAFEVSPFEQEFGRHIAVFHPGDGFESLKLRLAECGGTLIDPIRPTPFQRFFFREPVNGYVFEVIDQDHFIEE